MVLGRRVVATMLLVLLLVAAGQAASTGTAPSKVPLWRNPAASVDARVRDLLQQMNLEEKMTQFVNNQAAVPRLGIHAYDFWQECLHGLLEVNASRLPAPTIFPQPIGMAGELGPNPSFDTGLVGRVFDAVSTEARAKSNQEQALTGKRRGLVCWTPHVNLFRDPRWGRGSETYGEDPVLTARMAVAVVEGLQGNHPSGLIKAAATCKHFAGYSLEGADGWSRFSFDAQLTPQDLADTYLPVFEACVKEAGAAGFMCAYNAVNGIPSCASPELLQHTLRGSWNFSGYVVSDCGAIQCMTGSAHGYAANREHALALAMKAGTDLMCDGAGQAKVLRKALKMGLITAQDIDARLANSMSIRFRVGEFDPPAAQPPEWAALGPEVVNSKAHRLLAREAAARGIVLLKNDPLPARRPKLRPRLRARLPALALNGSAGAALPHVRAMQPRRVTKAGPAGPGHTPTPPLRGGPRAGRPLLPLAPASLSKLCVVGPLADSVPHMLGNYYGYAAKDLASPVEAIREHLAGCGVAVTYAQGAHLMSVQGPDTGGGSLELALDACAGADAAVVFLGTSSVNPLGWPTWPDPGPDEPVLPATEGEGLDKVHIVLPGRQQDVVDALSIRTSLPIVVVLLSGAPLDVSAIASNPRVSALLWAGSPGQEGGHAMADVLFGRATPSGRLPVSWYYKNFTEAARMTDMRMRPGTDGYPGRTYRFTTAPLLYPFGYGLSYTSFAYSSLTMEPRAAAGTWLLRVTVANTGSLPGAEAVLAFASHVDSQGKAGAGAPRRALRAFGSTGVLAPGAAVRVSLALAAVDFSLVGPDGALAAAPGRWQLAVGPLKLAVGCSAPAGGKSMACAAARPAGAEEQLRPAER